MPVATVERVLRLYRERYADFNVRHYHEVLQRDHGVGLSYSWVKKALQTALTPLYVKTLVQAAKSAAWRAR